MKQLLNVLGILMQENLPREHKMPLEAFLREPKKHLETLTLERSLRSLVALERQSPKKPEN